MSDYNGGLAVTDAVIAAFQKRKAEKLRLEKLAIEVSLLTMEQCNPTPRQAKEEEGRILGRTWEQYKRLNRSGASLRLRRTHRRAFYEVVTGVDMKLGTTFWR